MATETTKLTYIEGAAPATPAANRVVIYAKADGLMYAKDDAGTETQMGPGAGGIPATIFDAKGDIIAASAADTAAKVTAGPNGTLLIADSTQSAGLRWGSREVVYDFITGDETGKTDATLVNTGLSFAVLNGIHYRFRFTVVYRTTVTTVGIKLACTTPTFTVYSATGLAPAVVGSTGTTAGSYVGGITASADFFLSPSVPATNTDYIAYLEGVILPSADGTLMLQYAAETTGATVTMRRGSMGELVILG